MNFLPLVETTVVNWKTWGRGESGGYLLVDKKMCCLGFACKQSKSFFPEQSSLPDRAKPAVKILTRRDNTQSSGYTYSKFSEKASEINDKEDMEDHERINKLGQLWKKYGKKIRFKNVPKIVAAKCKQEFLM